jgi:hypothetical protein
MTTGPRADFDCAAVYAAMDEQRQARGLTWQQVMREVGGAFARAARPISPSTVTTMRTKAVAEGDGVLQMLRWLGRTPESFIRGHRVTPEDALAAATSTQILRFDTKQLHAALDAQRTERRLTWTQVASEIGGVSAAMLTHLSNGGRTGFPHVARIAGWLGRPVASFVRAVDR